MHVKHYFNAKNINICNIFSIFEMQARLKYFKNFPPEYRLCFRKMKKFIFLGKQITRRKWRLEFILKTWYEMQTCIRIEQVEHEHCVNINFNYVSDQQFSLISLLSSCLMQYYLIYTFLWKQCLLQMIVNKYVQNIESVIIVWLLNWNKCISEYISDLIR